MEEKSQPPVPPPAAEPEMEYCLRPACDWLQEVERRIEALSARREELRRQIQVETGQRQALNSHGEDRLSARSARELARTEVFGVDWRRAQDLLRQSRQRVRSARRQIRSLGVKARARQEGAVWWRYWLWQRPIQAWRARPLQRRLRQANSQRRAALVTLRAFRTDVVRPETRSRIFGLVESFLLKEERLSQSIESLKEAEQKISGSLSEALRLAPRLRDLGAELVPMQCHKAPQLRLANLPVPAGPLCAVKSAQKNSRGLRIR